MNSPQQYHLTEEGAERLRKELVELKGPRRTELAARLRAAIQQGDLSENADYHKAKEDQGFLEGRIQEIQNMLSRAVMIEAGSPNGVIELGSSFVLHEKGREPARYMLVGAREADPRNGKLSNESPIGMALLGHRVGETVTAKTPGGDLVFEIVEVG
ncbi:MAG: transcription elongation factor GreA [Anaerolineales bacterium]